MNNRSYDQGAWDAIGRTSWQARNTEQRLIAAFLWLASRLELSKADQRDLARILAGKSPYR